MEELVFHASIHGITYGILEYKIIHFNIKQFIAKMESEKK